MASNVLKKIARRAKDASEVLATLSSHAKNQALAAMARALLRHQRFILRENAKDVRAARQRSVGEPDTSHALFGGRAALRKRLPSSLVGRLELNEKKIRQMADSLRLITGLPDPIGRVLSTVKRPNGLLIKKIRVPLGVILIIYESRPNVTTDCIALCLKSGNSVILKGGSEAFYSNRAIYRVLNQAAAKHGIPQGAFELVATSDRAAVKVLLGLNEWIDLVIPRGGEGLIREVANISKIPVIKHFKGVCHVFVDKDADLKKSKEIILNAKVQNPAVCNAIETLLVHQSIAKRFLPVISEALKEKGVELRGCDKTRAIVSGINKASEQDWYEEYLDLILAVRVVKDLNEAVAHIQKYGSHHSDAIVTENKKAASIFSKKVDSACVFVNCSTRFNDGGEFGMGAEMGISTDKLHARGPMGLEELTSYKYVVLGDGQVRN